ncbi:MAG: methionyl-tRNA formyltransferase [Phycisphaerales bacterium]|nr:methionyl-tRNA formyltransferase [Phycisphaerales bacterium]
MRVVLLGNHTVGVRALDALRECAEVVGVVAHPADVEDGVRYASLYEHARQAGLRVARMDGNDAKLKAWIAEAEPDLLLTVDYRYLLSADVIALGKLGAINLHPSLLPKYRGRAPVNWAIINGDSELGLTAHFIDQGMDRGDIIAQERFTLTNEEDVGDALEKLYPMYERMVRRVIGYCQDGGVPRRPQNHAQATTFPRRRPEDGEIDWSASALEIHRLIRAVAAPYPGAFAMLGDQKLIIWRAAVVPDTRAGEPGAVVSGDAETGYVVCCGEGGLRLVSWECDGEDRTALPIGSVIGKTETAVTRG